MPQTLIGIVSDTHDQVANIRTVVRYLSSLKIALVIHCGDWVSPFSLEYYTPLQCQVMGIFGNNDGDKVRHIRYAKTFGLDVAFQDHFVAFERFGRSIAAYHGEHDALVDALVGCGKYDLVCHGHNHRAAIKQCGTTLSVNPGTLLELNTEGFLGPSIAIYDAERHDAALVKVSDLSEIGTDFAGIERGPVSSR
jgi:putative phosphoesterase